MIDKVKIGDKGVFIGFHDKGDCGVTCTLACAEEPKPAFKKALAALAAHVVHICELPDDWEQDLTVRGVAFTWKHEIMGARIMASRDLETRDGPFVFATPHAPEEAYTETEDGGEALLLTPECANALHTVLKQAEAYIAGQRAQGKLPFTE